MGFTLRSIFCFIALSFGCSAFAQNPARSVTADPETGKIIAPANFHTVAGAAKGLDKDVWLAVRTDGLSGAGPITTSTVNTDGTITVSGGGTWTIPGNGTQGDPYDASGTDGQKFDAIMRAFGVPTLFNYSGNIVSVSTGNPAIVTTLLPHGMQSSINCTLSGVTGSTPSVNSTYPITVLNSNQFTVPVNVTVAGTGGTFSAQNYQVPKVHFHLVAGDFYTCGALVTDPTYSYPNYSGTWLYIPQAHIYSGWFTYNDWKFTGAGKGVTRLILAQYPVVKLPVNIASISAANPAIVTTSTPHNIDVQNVSLRGVVGGTVSGGGSINGSYPITVIDTTHFSIPINVTVAPTASTGTAAGIGVGATVVQGAYWAMGPSGDGLEVTDMTVDPNYPNLIAGLGANGVIPPRACSMAGIGASGDRIRYTRVHVPHCYGSTADGKEAFALIAAYKSVDSFWTALGYPAPSDPDPTDVVIEECDADLPCGDYVDGPTLSLNNGHGRIVNNNITVTFAGITLLCKTGEISGNRIAPPSSGFTFQPIGIYMENATSQGLTIQDNVMIGVTNGIGFNGVQTISNLKFRNNYISLMGASGTAIGLGGNSGSSFTDCEVSGNMLSNGTGTGSSYMTINHWTGGRITNNIVDTAITGSSFTSNSGILFQWNRTTAGGTLSPMPDAVVPNTAGGAGTQTGVLSANGSGTVTGKASSQFRASMSTTQTLTASTWTKVVFDTSGVNIGSNYDAATNYRWTPPAGTVVISGQVMFNEFSGNTIAVAIYKNGSAFCGNKTITPGSNQFGIPLTIVDVANGTDYYELWAFDAGTSLTIFNTNTGLASWFSGSTLQ